jgi:hypothetical protein
MPEELTTPIFTTQPIHVRSAATITVLTWLALTKVVERGLSFQVMRESVSKPVPFTVRVNGLNAGPVNGTKSWLGEIVVTTGGGVGVGCVMGILPPHPLASQIAAAAKAHTNDFAILITGNSHIIVVQTAGAPVPGKCHNQR